VGKRVDNIAIVNRSSDRIGKRLLSGGVFRAESPVGEKRRTKGGKNLLLGTISLGEFGDKQKTWQGSSVTGRWGHFGGEDSFWMSVRSEGGVLRGGGIGRLTGIKGKEKERLPGEL